MPPDEGTALVCMHTSIIHPAATKARAREQKKDKKKEALERRLGTLGNSFPYSLPHV